MPQTQRGVEVKISRPYLVDEAIVQYSLVVTGVDAAHIKKPTAQGVRALGVAMQEATAAGQSIDVCVVGWIYVIDEAGTLNGGDPITTGSGAGAYHKAMLAATGDYVAGYVEGDDAAAAADLVLARIGIVDRIV